MLPAIAALRGSALPLGSSVRIRSETIPTPGRRVVLRRDCPNTAVRLRFAKPSSISDKGEQHVEAFAVPIKPGKEKTWKSWIAETNGARKAEFDEMNQRMGPTTHAARLQQNPGRSQLAVVVVDGPGASEFLGKLATSGHAFDTWFRTNVEDIHPLDFSAPPPPAPVRFL